MVADSIEHCEQTLMFTDIVGYSRLMGRNESLAVEMLGDYRRILLSHIEQQGGQLVEFVGDAIFARFNTAPSAVAAAIAIQQHLLAFNEARDKKLPRLQTRIGLHKGEVMLRDGAVFGDSVNIAARLEPLAVADGICISQTVYDGIRLTLSSPAKRLGLQSLKNIQQKIRVYLIKPVGIGWRDHLHYFLRGLNKNIVAYRYPLTACLLALIAAGVYFIPRWLVPGYAANYVEIADFKNLMNEKGDADYFSAGITETVRSQLADMRDVYIVDAKEGIHAPIRLEGSVQKLGDDLRIAYRLFRRKDNVQIAGGKLDGTYQDIFILQDRLVGEIARYLSDEFDLQNFRPAPLRLTGNVAAYDYYLQGMGFLARPSSQGNFDSAIQSFTQALVHDNDFIFANIGLCKTYRFKYEFTKLIDWLEKAESYCLKAVDQDKNSGKAYAEYGAVLRDLGRYAEALTYLQSAMIKNEDDVTAIVALARTYDFIKDKKSAENLFMDALNKSPKNWEVYQEYGYFLIRQGRYEDAVKNYQIVLRLTPDNVAALINIGAAYMYKGEFKNAADVLVKATDLEPDGLAFSNAGVMYYYSGDFSKSIDFYKKAIQLEPENVQYLINISDAYFFINNGKKMADKYFYKVKYFSEEKIKSNPSDISGYLYLSLAYIHFDDIFEAKEQIKKADLIDSNDMFGNYVKLRMAVKEKNESNLIVFVKKLQSSGYSEKLILADPYFSVLKGERFVHVFSK